MKPQRMAYWWFRFVVSGRFLEKFFNWQRMRRGDLAARKFVDEPITHDSKSVN
jgi:hypothetical protein